MTGRRVSQDDVPNEDVVGEPGLELDEILAMLSHELRTPLSTIAGYLEMISEDLEGRIAPKYQLILEAGQRNVTRMTRLLDDLLAISRDGVLVPGEEAVDLGRLLGEVVEDLTISAVRRSIDLVLDVPDEPFIVTGDAGQLYRACVNVVGNALKFSLEGGRVDVSLVVEAAESVVRVADRGIGIPADELDRLGSSFFRSSNAIERQISGTGLGLRIVQLVADAHRGALEIASEQDRGTTVTLRLPGPVSSGDRGSGAITAEG